MGIFICTHKKGENVSWQSNKTESRIGVISRKVDKIFEIPTIE